MYYTNTTYQYIQVSSSFSSRPRYRVIARNNYATKTIQKLIDDVESNTTYSNQYGEDGATLKDYMDTVKLNLPIIVAGCPDMSVVQDYYPMSYIFTYDYIDLLGNTTQKTSAFTAMKYTMSNGTKKVLFFGTGLQEFVVN